MGVRLSNSYLSSCHLWLLVVLASVHLCLSNQKSGNSLCMDGERQALLHFKHDLIDEADRLASWVGETSDCCTWAGIVCDNITGHVHEIYLRGLDGHCAIYGSNIREQREGLKQMLKGHLSPSLLELKQLKYLDLSCNDFKQIQIPSFIGSLRNLRYLNLSYSEFGGMIPPHIGNISELRVLSLGFLYETSIKKMQWMSSLRWLHHLDMSAIDLSKAIDWFQVINTLPSLVELHIPGCSLSDIHPHVPSLNVSSLHVLDLSYNYFDNTSVPQWIFSLTSLVSLDITYCNFNHPLPSSIYSFRNLTSLESLQARRNYLMNSQSVLKGLPSKLKYLDISNCSISSLLLDSNHNLTSLISLDLSHNSLDNISLTYLLTSLFNSKSLSLEILFIYNSGLSGPIPNSIKGLSSLKQLYLWSNRLNGSIPESIGQLSSLEVLDIKMNQLSGNLPVSLGQLTKLNILEFSYNLLTGVVTEAHFAKLVSLKYLHGEDNNLTLKVQVANWIPSFQVQILSLNSWGLGPEFPLWLQSQKDLEILVISNTGISSPMPPDSFWRSFPNLTFIDISQNRMKGALTLSMPATLKTLDLSSNKFTGKLPSLSNGSLMPVYLDLSNNSFGGPLNHFLCYNGVEETEFISLGHNHLSGAIPECWEKWSSLRVLKLENNNLSGEIPRTLGSLVNISWLNMHGNKISGRLPSSLMNLSSLIILQLGRNELVGSIPPWIGTKLTSLRILNVRLNNLDGNIPEELCYLSNTQVLDLSNNNLSGNIPRCFNNFSVLSGITNSFDGVLYMYSSTIASDTLVMKGKEYTYDYTLALVKLLDLSKNNFSGHIPSELTTLRELRSLNLSRNQLSGRIPEKIGDMKELESFDLSENKLSGELPVSLSGLNFLSNFNVSYNDLTGSIPLSTQIQSLNESSFFGNKLCGAPLSDHCVSVVTNGDQKEKKENDVSEWGLIISVVLGFVTGFWIIVAPLIVSTSWS